MTKDSVTVSVDAVVYYRVSNATVSVANVENAHHSTRCQHLPNSFPVANPIPVATPFPVPTPFSDT